MNESKTRLMRYITVLLASISGTIHVYLGYITGFSLLGASYLVAGAIFIIGIVSIAVNFKRKIVYLLSIPFLLSQIFIWYYVNRIPISFLLAGEPFLDTLDKLVQTILIILVSIQLYLEQN